MDAFTRVRRNVWSGSQKKDGKRIKTQIARRRIKTEVGSLVDEAFNSEPIQGCGAFFMDPREWYNLPMRERAREEDMEVSE